MIRVPNTLDSSDSKVTPRILLIYSSVPDQRNQIAVVIRLSGVGHEVIAIFALGHFTTDPDP